MSSRSEVIDVNWINHVQDRDRWRALVKTVLSFPDPYNARYFLNSRLHISFPGGTMLHGVSYLVRLVCLR